MYTLLQQFGVFDSVWMPMVATSNTYIESKNSRTSLISILLLYKYSSYDYRVIFFMSKCAYIFWATLCMYIYIYIYNDLPFIQNQPPIWTDDVVWNFEKRNTKLRKSEFNLKRQNIWPFNLCYVSLYICICILYTNRHVTVMFMSWFLTNTVYEIRHELNTVPAADPRPSAPKKVMLHAPA